jgi:hypothetical protein
MIRYLKMIYCIRNSIKYNVWDKENQIRKYEDLNVLYFDVFKKIGELQNGRI